MSRARVLAQLCRLLAGASEPPAAWDAILAMANLALVTPRLEQRLEALNAPQDVQTFVREVADRNRQRNRRLFGQMGEVAALLNAIDVTPLVIKGGAGLARTGGRSDRMISDLDLVVRPDQIEPVVRVLAGAGFSDLNPQADVRLHALATLARPTDVGAIDLHQRPPGPAGFVSRQEIMQGGVVMTVGAGRVRVPAPYMHIYLQALHDQFHDGGYWRGGFDLRHAWDIADLIEGPDLVDWDALQALPRTKLMTQAVEAQLMACHRLTGAPIPSDFSGLRARLRYRRQHVQHCFPALRTGFAALAMLFEAPTVAAHRRQDSQARISEGLPPVELGFTTGLGRLRQVLASHLHATAEQA